MRPAVRNAAREIISLNKAALDAGYSVTELSITEGLYNTLLTWMTRDDLHTFLHVNKKTGLSQRYTVFFSIRHVNFEGKDYYKILNAGADGHRKAERAELVERTPTINDLFRFIVQKYPNDLYRVAYRTNEPINF